MEEHITMEWHENLPDRPLSIKDLQALTEEHTGLHAVKALEHNAEGAATAVYVAVEDWAEAYRYNPHPVPELSDWETVWETNSIGRGDTPEEDAREALNRERDGPR